MNEVSADQLKRAVEAQHGGTATLVQSVPVHEKIQIETHRGNATHKGRVPRSHYAVVISGSMSGGRKAPQRLVTLRG